MEVVIDFGGFGSSVKRTKMGKIEKITTIIYNVIMDWAKCKIHSKHVGLNSKEKRSM